MKKPLHERILSEAQSEAKAIIKEAEKEANALLLSGKTALNAEKEEQLIEGEKISKARVKNYIDREENSLGNFQEQTRQQLVVSVFTEVSEKLTKLEGKELLAFVTSLIGKEKVSGDETLHVSKLNFKKYTDALGKNAEKLNSANATYTFKFSSEPTYIEEGFLLSGKAFDLVFDFHEIVDQYQKKNEQRIYHELFAHE